MPLEARLPLGLALALSVVFWATPVAIRVANRLEFFDRPAGGYKDHARPTPYLGGSAVMLGFALAVALLAAGHGQRTATLLAGAAILWGLGTLDDRRHVTPVARVAVEIALAAVVWQLGYGWDLGLGGGVDLVVTTLWVVAVINALNLFDNMDGAASTLAAVIAAGLAVLGAVHGDVWVAVAATALCGACLGFLPHNLASPARIFLGDGGSMPVGFVIAVLAMVGARSTSGAGQALAIGVLLVGVPALDTALVVVSRTRRGMPIWAGGRDHLTHRARRRMGTAIGVAVALGSIQALLSTLALVAADRGGGLLVPALLVYLVGAGSAIAMLESGSGAERREASAVGRRWWTALPAESVVLVPIGIGIGISPWFGGYYDATTWAPVGLGLVVVATAAAIVRGASLRWPGAMALGALALVGLLSLLSSSWSSSAEGAVVEANRWLLYATLLGLLLLTIRDRRTAMVALGAFTAAAVVVALVDLVRLLEGDAGGLFLTGRLNTPLGYINGQADFFLLALWPCLALAEQRRRAWIAGPALAASVLLCSLLLLSQSRGVVLAAAASVLAAVVLVPGRLRRLGVLAVVAAGVAAAGPALVHVYDTSLGGVVDSGPVANAGAAALIAAVVAGAVWAFLVQLVARTAAPRLLRVRRLAIAGLAVALVAGLGVAVARQAAVRHDVHRQWTAFVRLDPTQGGEQTTSRLVSGGGNRYDYWRIAWRQWKDRPLAGAGAGAYPVAYFRDRRTTEDVRQPHSVELQLLSELGVLGIAALAAFVVAVGFGVRRRLRAARSDAVERGLTVAALGAFVAWLVHTSVDWMHLLPGLTAAALVAVAVLLRPGEATARRSSPALARRAAIAFGAAAILLLAGASLSRQTLSDRFRADAQSALAKDPNAALRDANRALRLDPDAVETYYVKAAALARFDQGGAAVRVLADARRREPDNFLTSALLGDLYVRLGDRANARRAYATAHALNPRDPGLAVLARDPTASGASNRG